MANINDTIFKATITVVVPYATDRFYLNKNRVEEGWLVFANDTSVMYLIKDSDNLDNTDGYTNLTSGGGVMGEWSDVPFTSTSTGTAGDMAYDNSYIYVCIATDTWRRAPLNDWS